MGNPAKRQQRGPAPNAKDSKSAEDHCADQLEAGMLGWRFTLQAEQNVGDGGESKADAVRQHLAARDQPPREKNQYSRTDNADDDADFRGERLQRT